MTLLRQRMLEDMQIRNFSENTQDSYLQQVSLFARHFRRSPAGLGPVNIRTYQVYLTNEKKLAPSSISIATSALRFLYTVTLLRHGASLAEIGELLGHLSPETTKIYAKVDLEVLRTLALPWPGGAR